MRCSSHAREALDKAVIAYAEHIAQTRTNPPADQAEAQKTAARLRDEIVQKRFEYATTPEGREEAQRAIAEQQARADAERESLGGDKAPHHAVFSAPENKTLRAMQDAQRKADNLRAVQSEARDRYNEVQKGKVGEKTAQALADERDKPAERIRVEDSNGNWHSSTIIGVVAVDEPFTKVDNSFETAAWSRTHEVQPGIYPVHLTDRGDLTYGYDTVVTDENFPALFGGVPIGGAPDPKDGVGKPGHVSGQMYAFSAPSAHTPGMRFAGGSLVLRKDVEVGHDIAVRDGQVSSVLTRFKVDNAVDTEPQYNEYRRRRLA